jgi:beta-1,4-mannosyl-glycoprotein beta-1,4-N-acetylglucosaminyltransferase
LKVHDCILFSNEVDLLYLRLSELDPVVDDFVIIQATTTFQGAERQIVSLESDARLEQFSAKLRHIVVDDLPRGTSPWFAEYVQRNRVREALVGQAEPDDLIVLSDVDEIPSRAAVEQARMIDRSQVGAFNMRFFYYGLNWEVPFGFRAAKVFRAEALSHVSTQELRSCRPDIIFRESGWHFSYFYKRRELVQEIQKKAGSFAHTEFSGVDYLRASYLD